MLNVSRFDPERHLRKSVRLHGYDYSQPGLYFITICTNDRKHLLGRIEKRSMILNQFGQIAFDEWLKTAEIRSEIILDEFVIMPNHVHGIIKITDPNPVGAYGNTPQNDETHQNAMFGNGIITII